MNDKLYVYPTDTVWGIGGNILSEMCYKKIAGIKGHDAKKPLSIVFKNYEMISDLIDLPEKIDQNWLNYFFSLESTIGFPKSWVKKELPSWICQNSEFISVRCLDTEELSPIFEEVGGPITSTSLNLTGEDPISKFEDAQAFFDKYMNSEYFSKELKTKCSGRSSTIVLYDTPEIRIVREGKYIEEIKKHICLLTA